MNCYNNYSADDLEKLVFAKGKAVYDQYQAALGDFLHQYYASYYMNNKYQGMSKDIIYQMFSSTPQFKNAKVNLIRKYL